ncbi:MAG: hypothetical protein GWO20_18925 [Candidatus Korarchaeota archaeon]|nr:hypothetical protein [Candidatus Korarchaeota archaeon]NIU85336.1 hypothetical protein [Candidatus Thorarchaeota archaeon]NIW15426.1 hypothetical protein [Candidatus Thorarchaeota archaeon]NIW53372.1 hypothetical protein [Candidatus Korarchaeota archaeon]
MEEELRRRQISFETKEVPTSNILQKIESTDRIAIKEADCVINLEQNPKKALILTRAIRDVNQSCALIFRFFLDSIANILEDAPFNAKVISSSKNTLQILRKKKILP